MYREADKTNRGMPRQDGNKSCGGEMLKTHAGANAEQKQMGANAAKTNKGL